MKKEVQEGGVTSAEMSVAELKALAVQNNLDIKGLRTKPELLKVVRKWEKSILKETDAKVEQVKKAAKPKASAVSVDETPVVESDVHEAKKITGRRHVTKNGIDYEEITTVGDVKFLVRLTPVPTRK